MKIRKMLYIVIPGVIVFVGLVSLLFLPGIQAALLTGNSLSSAIYINSHMTTPQPPAKPKILAQDTFQRADNVYWGKASDGLVWGADANASQNFVIMNRSGQIIDGSGVYSAVLGPMVANAEIVVSGSLSTFDQASIGAILRWQNANNWYKAFIDKTHLTLLKDTNGTLRQIATMPFAAAAGISYTLRFHIVGTQMWARAWPTAQAEAMARMITATDTSIPSGSGGIRLLLEAGASATITIFTESTAVLP